jgi:hypothetical protein
MNSTFPYFNNTNVYFVNPNNDPDYLTPFVIIMFIICIPIVYSVYQTFNEINEENIKFDELDKKYINNNPKNNNTNELINKENIV